MDKLESPINLPVMFLDYGRKSEHPERRMKIENMQTTYWKKKLRIQTQDLNAEKWQQFWREQ